MLLLLLLEINKRFHEEDAFHLQPRVQSRVRTPLSGVVLLLEKPFVASFQAETDVVLGPF